MPASIIEVVIATRSDDVVNVFAPSNPSAKGELTPLA
jgi:hypothetical protein